MKKTSKIAIKALANVLTDDILETWTGNKPGRKAGKGDKMNNQLQAKTNNQTCETCEHWNDSTAECCIALREEANGREIPDTVQTALDLDCDKENECEFYA